MTYQFFAGLPGPSPTETVNKLQFLDPSNDFGNYQTLFEYDTAGNVTRAITEGLPAGSTTYNINGQITQQVDATGVTSSYIYDALGHLRESKIVGSSANVGTTTNTYDKSGRLKTVTDALGRQTAYDYDGNGRLIKTTFADGTFTTHEYDAAGNCVAITNELGHTTRFVYDARNRLIQTIHPDGSSTRTQYDGAGQVVATFDELGRKTEFTYDKAGRLLTTKHTLTYNGVQEGNVVETNSYDTLGRLTTKTDANGDKTTYGYDKLNRVVEMRVLKDASTSLAPVFLSTTEYDPNGNISRTTVYDVVLLTLPVAQGGAGISIPTSHQAVLALIDSHPNFVQTVEPTYDAFGRPVEVTNADGTKTSTIYDAAGRVRFTFDELGRKTERVYDGFGRLERIISPDPDGLGGDVSPRTRYVRDAAGNVTEAWQFFGMYNGVANAEYAERYKYDARNRLVTTTLRDGKHVHGVYDAAGQLVATVDALGNANYLEYDQRGRAIAQWSPDPDGADPLSAPVTRHEYDATGNVVTTIDHVGNVTEFAYDSLNRLRKEISTVLYDIVDNTDPRFNVSNTSATQPPVLESNPAAFGGSQLAIAPNSAGTASGRWYFPDMPAGTYRFLGTWTNDADSASSGYEIFLINNSPPYEYAESGVDFRIAPTDFVREFAGQWNGWEQLGNDRVVNAGDDVAVYLQGSALNADAVRVDRVVAREFLYDKNGNLLNEKDELGRVTAYAYDELGRQTAVQLPDPDAGMGNGGPNNQNLGAPVTQTYYDGYGNVIQTRENRGTSGINDDRITSFQFDRRNRLIERNIYASNGTSFLLGTSYKYDAVGNLIEETDPVGTVTRYRYDQLDRLVDQYDDFGQGASSVPELTFDPQLLVQPAPEFYSGPVNVSTNGKAITLEGNTWVYAPIAPTWVRFDTILEFTIQSENAHEYLLLGFDNDTTYTSVDDRRTFDLGGRAYVTPYFNQEFRTEKFPNGPVTIHIPIGQYLTDEEKASGLLVNHLMFTTGAIAGQFDPADVNRVTFSDLKLYQSDEVRTVTKYDARGNVETVREASDPRNITTRFEYDRLGRWTDEYLDHGGPQARHFRTTYDAAGQVTVERNVTAGTETRHTYDRLGRLIATTLPDPDGNPATPNGLVTTFGYDAAGHLVRTTNGEGESRVSHYNEQGQVVREIDGNGDETHYRYDAVGNLTSVTDAEGNTTSSTYDRLNRLKTDTNAFGTRTYIYNNAGNLDRYFDRNGRHIQYVYDSLDRRITEYWRTVGAFAYGGPASRVYSWEYDQLGRITKQVNGVDGTLSAIANDVVETFVYDGLGRLTQQANYDPANLGQGSANGVPRVRQEYLYGFGYSIAFPSGTASFVETVRRREYFRNAQGAELRLGALSSTFDRLGRLEWEDDSDFDYYDFTTATPAIGHKSFHYSYDTAGNLSQIQRGPGGPTSTYAYDNASRLTSITHDLATDIVHAYGYDDASRIVDFDTTTNGFATSHDYTYDDAGQLTGDADANGYGSFYTYDANGNRVYAHNGAVGPFPAITVGPGNRLESDHYHDYQYDAEGNLTLRTGLAGDTTQYAWDHRNQLTGVTYKDAAGTVTQSLSYLYDAEGRLVKRTHDANGTAAGGVTSETFVYSASPSPSGRGQGEGELAMSFNNAGKLAHRYLHGPADQVLVDEVFKTVGSQQVSDEVLWQLGDHQGTVRDIVDGNGQLRKHVEYDPFGAVIGEVYRDSQGNFIAASHAAAVDQLFYYTGQLRDEVTGDQLHGARWYSPQTGRWLSEDPLGFDAGDPNLYRYVGNSPLNAVDPTGLKQAGNPLHNINLFDPIGSLTKPFANVGYKSYGASSVPVNTLGSALGNAVYQAAPSLVAPLSKAALSAGVSLVSSIPTFGQVGSSSPDRYITDFGGQAIPARQQHELPIRVQQAIEQPDRYLVSPHQGQGYFIADPSGAVKFVNNPEVLPTATLMNEARRQTSVAAGQQRALQLAGETLISFSPVHEISRDLGIVAFGYDYYEPNQRFSAHDRAAAGLLSVVPGGNSGQIRTGDALIDAVRGGAYVLRDPATGQVMRSGRTGDLVRRLGDHARDPLLRDFDFDPVYRTDVYVEQRGLEQLLHDTYNPPLNKINPVSPRNPNQQQYLDAAQEFLRRQGG